MKRPNVSGSIVPTQVIGRSSKGDVGIRSVQRDEFEDWIKLTLDVRGDRITASIDGVVVGDVSNKQYSTGMAAVGSGWNHVAFTNLSVSGL